jgi:Dolichyl-phosphate-mannose-protein mannosyltransferase
MDATGRYPPLTPARHAGVIEFLRRPAVAVTLLALFTLLVNIYSQRLSSSIDEGTQFRLAHNSLFDLLTNHIQDHPFYGVLVHLSMQAFPDGPIHPVRIPSFVAGMAFPVAFYLTQRRYAGHEGALLVAMILVMTDPVRFYMSIGRGYLLMMLGVTVINFLLLQFLRRGGWWRAAIYVPVAALSGFTHLWAYPVVGAHGLFLAWEVLRNRRRGRAGRLVARRALGMIVAVALALMLGVGLYVPMLDEIRQVSSMRGGRPILFMVVDAILQLPRFASWTIAAHFLLAPIVLEGFARRPMRRWLDRPARMALLAVLALSAWAAVMQSVYFGSRYFVGMIPGVAAVVARGLSGYWRGRTEGLRLPRLPRGATRAVGLALGVLAANASIAHELPAGATMGRDGRDSGYYYRDLAKLIGDPAAAVILAVGAGALAFARPGSSGPTAGATDANHAEIPRAYLLTALLIASLVPIFLSSSFSKPLFELHMIAVAAVVLDAWEHRYGDRHLHALRFAFLTIAGLAVAWQLDIDRPDFSPWAILGLAMYVPPILIVLPLVRTTAPAFSDGDDAASPRH